MHTTLTTSYMYISRWS